MNPGGGSGRDEPPLDIQIPDDARELERDVLAYHRELRARRRRSRLRRLTGPFAGQGTVMPLLASILAVCLVAGAMLSVATFSPATAPEHPGPPPVGHGRLSLRSAQPRSSPENSARGLAPAAPRATASAVRRVRHRGTARPSGAANSPPRSSPSASRVQPTIPPGSP